jgi:VCBS repeat-containing protein
MAAVSNNKYDIFNWISQVINSCTNVDQLNNAERLVERFKVNNQDDRLYFKLWAQLAVTVKKFQLT